MIVGGSGAGKTVLLVDDDMRTLFAGLPLDRVTTRPLRPVEEPEASEVVEEVEALVEDDRRLSSRPPEYGQAPSIRAIDD